MKNDALDLRRLADMSLLGVEFHSAALVITGDLTYKQFERLGSALGNFHDASKWWIGDWLLHGDDAYGDDKMAQLTEATGRAYHTLQNYRWVASKWADKTRRRPLVPHSMHAELASLAPAAQVEWLDRIEANTWKLEELREHLRESRRDERPRLPGTEGDGRVTVDPDERRVVQVARAIVLRAQPSGDGRFLVDGELIAQLRAAFGDPE
jgi:hypothetical protein